MTVPEPEPEPGRRTFDGYEAAARAQGAPVFGWTSLSAKQHERWAAAERPLAAELADARECAAYFEAERDAWRARAEDQRAVIAEMREHILSGDDYANPAKLAGWCERAGLAAAPGQAAETAP